MHNPNHKSINQLRRNERDKRAQGSFREGQNVTTIVEGIMQVGFEIPKDISITEGDMASLPDFFKIRLGEITGANGEHAEYARVSMVSGFTMVQPLESHFKEIGLNLLGGNGDIDQKIESIFSQLGVHDCFPSEKWKHILGNNFEGLGEYVYFEALSTALQYILNKNK